MATVDLIAIQSSKILIFFFVCSRMGNFEISFRHSIRFHKAPIILDLGPIDINDDVGMYLHNMRLASNKTKSIWGKQNGRNQVTIELKKKKQSTVDA